MIDPTLALQTTQPNTGQLLSQVGNIQGQQQTQQIQAQEAQQNQQLNQQKIQGGQMALNQAGQSAQDQADYRAAMAAAVDPNTGQVDRGTLLSTLGKLNPVAAAQTATTLSQQDTAAKEAAAKLQEAQTTAITAHLDLKDKLLQGVSDQATYTNARNIAIQNGINPAEMPAQYDPQFVAQAHAQTLSQQQAFQQQLDTQKEKDAAAKALADQPLATRATAIYAIPAAQRTPEQNAFITGYEKNNNLTKIQPAQVRVQAMLSMPQAVVDPNDPSKTVFVTKQNSIGQEAPSSGEAAGARKVLTSAIGGPIGANITALNTAQGHIHQLFDAADALDNGNLPALNKIANTFGVQTGSSAPLVFQSIKTALTGELGKAFTGAGATVSEQAELAKSINDASSPKQIKDVATTFNHLMDTKRAALQQQVQQGQQGKPNFTPASSESAPSASPQSHQFSLSAWQQANPKGDPLVAKRAAQQQGFTVVQ